MHEKVAVVIVVVITAMAYATGFYACRVSKSSLTEKALKVLHVKWYNKGFANGRDRSYANAYDAGYKDGLNEKGE